MNRPDNSPTDTGVKYVSTAQVAQALGVSVTTVKRWVDDGIIPANRTAGGHRKVSMADVLLAIRQGNLPQADLSQLVPEHHRANAAIDTLLTEFLRAAKSLDAEQMGAILQGAYRSGVSIATLADKVISPMMVQMGDDWHAGKLSVSTEHRIFQACLTALYGVQVMLQTTTAGERPVAIGGAPEHDHALMSSLLAKMTLMECGWDAVNLGPHTPTFAFLQAIDELKPKLIWLTVTHLTHPEAFVADYTTLYQLAESRGIAVMIGGGGLTGAIRKRLLYTTFGDGFEHLAAFARTLHQRPQRPPRGRPAQTESAL